MSKNFSQQEENFWPCVSYMFLALFIIALALYSTTQGRLGEGDLKVQKSLIQETCAMLNELDTAFPKEGFGEWTIEIRKEHLDEQDKIKEDCKGCAKHLYLYMEKTGCRRFGEKGKNQVKISKHTEMPFYTYTST